MAKKNKQEIGKGIRALLSNLDNSPVEEKKSTVEKLSSNTAEILLTSIEINPFQPRTEFDPEALRELSESISIHGLIQPITVRRLDNKKFQLISGERRLRASKLAGLKSLPAYIRLADDQEMLEMALVENIQREDLNAIEVAITYSRLMSECELTQEGLSKRVAKKRSTISNYIRLLKLPPEIQLGIKTKQISMGHARALAGIENIDLQLDIYKEVIANNLSVRKTEDLIRSVTTGKEKETEEKINLVTADHLKVQEDLCARFGSKVALKVSHGGKGQIVIPFMSSDDLNRILDILEE